jgi:ABC-2 type transport system permease protein
MAINLGLAGAMATLVFLALRAFGFEEGDVHRYLTNYGNWVAILVALGATFFGGDALAGEFEHRTGYLLFPNPVGRWTIFTGKALAAIGLAALGVGVFYSVMAMASLGVKGSLPLEVAYSLLLAILYTLAAVGVALLLSASLRSTTIATILTFFLFFLLLPIVNFVFTLAQVRPIGILTFAGQTAGNILAGPYPEGYPGDQILPGGPTGRFVQYSPEVGISVAVMAAWALVAFALALLVFRRREMVG